LVGVDRAGNVGEGVSGGVTKRILKETRAVFDQLTDRPIAFHPSLVRICKSLAGGVLLSQLLYWSKVMRGKVFYKTNKELISETGLTEMEMRGAKKRLKGLGFISTKLKRHPATTHYKIHEDCIIRTISSLGKLTEQDGVNHPNKMGQFNQTIYTENTTENTKKDILSGKPDPAVEIIRHLNKKSGRSFKSTTKATQRLINARLHEGFTVKDFKAVHDKKIQQWIDDSKMRKYIRPETLYAASHFESYLNEPWPEKPEPECVY
jgi:uncharacterized phage protein (TIGR02220 family)